MSSDAARRRKAEDFEQFEPLFKQKHPELRAGTSKLLPYPGMAHIVPGAFFVLNGVMLFIAEVGETEYKKSTVRENKRERLRCILEKGTESSMCRQSLAIRLSDEDGQILAPTEIPEILTDDEVSGYIYVLRSLSDDPQVSAQGFAQDRLLSGSNDQNLWIGCRRVGVKERTLPRKI